VIEETALLVVVDEQHRLAPDLGVGGQDIDVL
jgi:hypothetical protein